MKYPISSAVELGKAKPVLINSIVRQFASLFITDSPYSGLVLDSSRKSIFDRHMNHLASLQVKGMNGM